MGSFCGSGGGGGGSTTTVNKTINKMPEYMEKGGEAIYEQAKPLAARGYEQYGGDRIAGFGPDTTQSFDMVRDASGAWTPSHEAARTATGQAMAPVSQADIDRYMSPYTEQVINPTLDQIHRQAGRETVSRHGSMGQRGSFQNDRRRIMDIQANEATNRVAAETAAKLRMGGFQQALQQANQERGMQMQGAGMYSQLAPQASQLGYQDAAAMAGIGQTQQAQEQQNLSLAEQDFLQQFYYPQEQLQWLQQILTASPYTTQQQSSSTGPAQPAPNYLAQTLGGVGALMGGYGMMK